MPDAHCNRPARDGCVVETAPLAFLVRSWIDRYERDLSLRDSRGQANLGRLTRRDASGHFIGPSENAESGVAALASLTERSAQGRDRVHPDKIRKVLRVAHRTTELRTADMLVAAIRRPEAFYDGTLTVSQNPLADRRTRASCRCGSSLNGSAGSSQRA